MQLCMFYIFFVIKLVDKESLMIINLLFHTLTKVKPARKND